MAKNKPNSDYYRLDMVLRRIKDGKLTDEIILNYKEYVDLMAAEEHMSRTRYIQRLIENDMKANSERYEQLKSAAGKD